MGHNVLPSVLMQLKEKHKNTIFSSAVGVLGEPLCLFFFYLHSNASSVQSSCCHAVLNYEERYILSAGNVIIVNG